MGGQGLGGADDKGVLVDGPHLAAGGDEPGRQDRNCARSASHVGDDRAPDDPRGRPLRRLALVGASAIRRRRATSVSLSGSA